MRPPDSVRFAEAAPQAQPDKVSGASHVDVLLGLGILFTRRDAVLQLIDAFRHNLAAEGVDCAPLTAAASRRGI